MKDPPTSIDATTVNTLRPRLSPPAPRGRRRVQQRLQTQPVHHRARHNNSASATSDPSSNTAPIPPIPPDMLLRWTRPPHRPHRTGGSRLSARPVRWCWRRRWARPSACLPGDRRAGGRGIGHAGPGFSRRGPDSGRPRPRRAGRDRAGRLRPHRHVRVSCPHAPVRAWFAPPARTGFVWCARMPALHATTRYLVRYGKCLPRAAGAVTVPQRERRGAAARRRRAACLAWDGITHD